MNRGAFGIALTNASTNLGTHVHGITSFPSFSCNLNLSFQRNLDEIRESVPRFPLPAIRGTEPSFTLQRTNFLTGWTKFDRTLRSPGTVRYFRSVHTKLTNEVEFQLFSVCGFTVCPCAERYFSRSKMAQSRPQCFHPLTREIGRTFTRCRANLDGPVRNTFIVFCWNPSRDNLAPGFPRALHPWPSCAEEPWGSRLQNDASMQLRLCHTKI